MATRWITPIAVAACGLDACGPTVPPKTMPVAQPPAPAQPNTWQSTVGLPLRRVPEGSFGAGAYLPGPDSGNQVPTVTQRVNAVYPASAMKAKVQGEVIVEAIIAKDGSVRNVRVVRSAVPDLDQAALDAVKQWKYAPTLLDGVPVEVLISVVISFNLRAPLPSSTLPPAV